MKKRKNHKKVKLTGKPFSLLIQFFPTKNMKGRVQSFRGIKSLDRAYDIIARRNLKHIAQAVFIGSNGEPFKLQLK